VEASQTCERHVTDSLLFVMQNYIRENVYPEYYALEAAKFRDEHICKL